MSERVFLQGLEVACGRHTYPQARLAEEMRQSIAHLPDAASVLASIAFVYARSGIDQRHLEVEIAEIGRRVDWYPLVNEATASMAARAIEGVLAAGIEATRCDGLIVVSSSYAGFPSLGRRLQERFGFPLSAPCWDLAGLGCAAAPQGLHLADTLIRRGTCRNVCVVCVDAMGTHSHSRRHDRAFTDSSIDVTSQALAGERPLKMPRGRWYCKRLSTAGNWDSRHSLPPCA